MIPFAAEPILRGVDSGLDERTMWWLEIMGRLKPGVTLEQANAALATLQPGIRAAAMPERTESFLEDPLTLVSASTGRSPLRNRFETPLRAMQATVAVVLLIACASLANLMLARALARRRELSVRLALGASRWRVTRLLAVETAVIVAAGAGLGVLFAKWSSALLVQQLATWRGSVFLDLSLDWRVLGFTAGLAAVTAVIAGIVPALSVTGVAPGDAMKESSRTVTGDRRLSVRGALVVAQIALSLVLVVGAGLFLRTFAALSGTRLGFAAGGLTVANVNLPAAVAEPAARRDLLERLDAAIAAAPGVRAAGLSVIAPITGSGWNDQIGTAGRRADRGEADFRQRGHATVVQDHGHPAAQRARLRSGRSHRRAGCHDCQRDVRPPVPRRPAAARAAHHGWRSSGSQGIRSRRRGLGRGLSLAARGCPADDVPAARGAGIALPADHADPFDVDGGPVDRRSAAGRYAPRRRSRPDVLDPRLRSVHPRRPHTGAPGGHAVRLLRRARAAARGDRPLRRRRPCRRRAAHRDRRADRPRRRPPRHPRAGVPPRRR